MSEIATTRSRRDDSILDELVPPPGPRWRRLLLWAAFLGLVGAGVWAITSGTVAPHVSTSVEAWGGTGPVGVTTAVQNRSRVDIEVVDGPRPRPGLSLIGYTTGSVVTLDRTPTQEPSNPFPLRLAPGERTHLTAWYRVTDCQAVEGIDGSDDAIDLQVRIADGPASWITAERQIEAPHLGLHGPGQGSWPAAVAEHACTN